jgi:hypothetical protein
MDPFVTGVPFGCRSPRNWGPYSMPIHNDTITVSIHNLQALKTKSNKAGHTGRLQVTGVTRAFYAPSAILAVMLM